MSLEKKQKKQVIIAENTTGYHLPNDLPCRWHVNGTMDFVILATPFETEAYQRQDATVDTNQQESQPAAAVQHDSLITAAGRQDASRWAAAGCYSPHHAEYLAQICIPNTAGSSYIYYKQKYGLSDECAEGKEPLWPVSVQHETHYFIFAVAVTHILYCAVTIALTLHKVATWRQWEDEALAEAKSSSGDVKVMQETVSRSLIRSMCTSALAAMSARSAAVDLVAHVKALATSVAAQFRVSVSQPMYHNVRLLFIEKMGLTYDFDFHALVTNGMENQLAHAVHASWPLWMIATFFLVLPNPSYVPFWSYCVVMLLMLVVAIKYGDSVLFGRMEMEPRALVRTGPARRRMSLSQLADALGDAVDGAADGILLSADGGDGGHGAGGEGGAGVAVTGGGTGAHVLDEALPAGSGAEVQAQVAAITALTSREEAVNLLRTMAARPLLPEPHPPPLLLQPKTSELRSQADAAAVAASTVSPAGNGAADAVSTAGTPKLMPSPSLLQGIAPPRWGPRPAAAAAAAAPPQLSKLPAPPAIQKKKKKPHAPPPVRVPAPLPDIRPISPVLNVGGPSGPAGTHSTVSPFTATSPASQLTYPSPGPVVPPQEGSGDIAITVAAPDGSATAAATNGSSDPVVSQLTSTVRPSSAVRPSTASLLRTAAAAAAVRPSSPPLPSLLSLPPGGTISPLLATGLPGSRGLNAVVAAATWANTTTRRNTSRPSAGLMLCGVATSRVATALEQMQEAAAIAATAAELSASEHPEILSSLATPGAGSVGVPVAATGVGGGGGVRPVTPSAATAGVAGFLTSLRRSRIGRLTDDSRRLTDMHRLTDNTDGGFLSPRLVPRQVSRVAMQQTGTDGLLPTSRRRHTEAAGGISSDAAAAYTLNPAAAAATAAAAAAALLRQLPPARPIRRCMSARQLICTSRIGEEDFSKTLVRPHAANANDATYTNSGVCAPKSKAVVLRPGGVQDDSALGLQVGLDLLPAPNFGPRASAGGPLNSPRFPKLSTAGLPIGLFGPRKKAKKAQRPSAAAAELQAGAIVTSTSEAAGGGEEVNVQSGVLGPQVTGAPAPLGPELMLSLTAVAPEISGSAAAKPSQELPVTAATVAAEDAAAKVSEPEPSAAGPPGAGAFVAAAPRTRGAGASAFALFQEKMQQGVGGVSAAHATSATVDLASVYDSLSTMLPPPPPLSPGTVASMLPGFVLVTDNGSSGGGAAAAAPSPPPAPTGSITDGVRAGDAGEEQQTAVPSPRGPTSTDTSTQLAESPTSPAPAGVSVDPLPSPLGPPDLSSSLEVSRPRSGLRVLRMGDDGPWVTVEEAVTLAMGTSAMDSMDSTGAAATVAGAAAEPIDGRYVNDDELDERPPTQQEQQHGASLLLLPNSPELRETTSLEAPLPRGGGGGSAAGDEPAAGARQRGFSSVFSMNTSPRLDQTSWSQPPPPPATSGEAVSIPPLAADAAERPCLPGGGDGGAIRTAAAVEGSGELSAAAPESETECTDGDGDNGGDDVASNGPQASGYGLAAAASDGITDGYEELTLGGAALRLATAAATETSARGGAELPPSPTGMGMPMILHFLETVPEDEEAEAEAQAREVADAAFSDANADEVVAAAAAATELQDLRDSRRSSRCAAAEEVDSTAKLDEVQTIGSPSAQPPLLAPGRTGTDDNGNDNRTTSEHEGGGYSRSESLSSPGNEGQNDSATQQGDGPAGELGSDLESTFRGFGLAGAGRSAVDLDRTAPRIGLGMNQQGEPPTPPRISSRAASSLGSQGVRGSGSAVSLLSLAPWGADGGGGGGGGGSEFEPSRPPSVSVERCSGSGSVSRPESAAVAAAAEVDAAGGRGSRSASPRGNTWPERGLSRQDDTEAMPPPPPAPPVPPPAPPPPPQLCIGGTAAGAERWAVVVPPSLRGGISHSGRRGACASGSGYTLPSDHNGVPEAGLYSAQSVGDLRVGPVCEGVGTVGREDVLMPVQPSTNPSTAAAAAGGACDTTTTTTTAASTTTFVSPFGDESLRTTAAGIAAGHIWRDLAKEHHDQRHAGHGSDSESDDGIGCCHTLWPPCVPKPWHRRQVMPLPAPVRDLKNNLAAGMDKAKVALASAAGDVAGKLHVNRQQSKQLQRKVSDHWLERVRNMLAAHKGFETMDASAFFWFHNPKVIAYLFNWVYYENSLSIAMLIFSLILGYQQKWVFKGTPTWAVGLLLLADVLILVHSCLYVLPLYALITPVGSHCPKEVLRRALKAGVFTRQTALIAKALHLQLKAREAAAAAPPRHSLIDRINQHWRKSGGVGPVSSAGQSFDRTAHQGQQPGGGGGDAALLLSANGTLSPNGHLAYLLSLSSGGVNGALSPSAGTLSPPKGGGGSGGGGGGLHVVGSGNGVGAQGGGSGGGVKDVAQLHATSLKVIDLTEPGPVRGRDSAAPAPAAAAGPIAVSSSPETIIRSDTAAGDGAGGGSVAALGLAPPPRSGPAAPQAQPSAAAAAVGLSVEGSSSFTHEAVAAGAVPVPVPVPRKLSHLRPPEGAEARGDGVVSAAQHSPVPPAPGGPHIAATAAHPHPTPGPLARLMKPFRPAQPAPPPSAAVAPTAAASGRAVAAAGPSREASSRHSQLSNAQDDVVPFTSSGATPSPSDSMLGMPAATAGNAAAATAPPRLRQSLQGGPSTDLLDMSLMRDGGLQRQGSRDSFSSTVGNLGTIRALMDGMYRRTGHVVSFFQEAESYGFRPRRDRVASTSGCGVRVAQLLLSRARCFTALAGIHLVVSIPFVSCRPASGQGCPLGPLVPSLLLPAGPGTGKYPGAMDSWNAGTAVYGRSGGINPERPWQTSSLPYSGDRYLKPDYLSQNPKGPAYSFGQRTGKGDGASPGVGTYSPNTDTFSFPRMRHAVWGPPPRRPPSAPARPRPEPEEGRRRPKPNSALPGATFKGKHFPGWYTDGPGPAYKPCCGGHCCDACEKYNGVSFGVKHHIHQEPPTPAPDYYRVACSSLGAAAAGRSEEDPTKTYYHKPGRRDHSYANGLRP
ncbi:hypothetical protein VOLCADRAFT_89482 [Volvox carteri f. nagariensis]|uniref:MLO-like protein n=1 Tax=Volvox carteri f. nagariensis TaxID=3068 RepID=D8TRY4_VOLCA|nr:uncharacterized protein VOLCADRAFT_89482 [Volvox carteri f. nagariensis]EFJ49600.1 hypothetical protein VOLCADRAFT_89482 [Volvox carteri f. nagariensis]|eukprot:XP_002949107.1 hypothetical protein VOLCADRAFT_89482 [Volvox carteri f. nagariensis]